MSRDFCRLSTTEEISNTICRRLVDREYGSIKKISGVDRAGEITSLFFTLRESTISSGKAEGNIL